MTPTNDKPPAQWWQSLLISLANIAVGALVQHYLGPTAGAASVTAGTVIAHQLPSPRQNGR